MVSDEITVPGQGTPLALLRAGIRGGTDGPNEVTARPTILCCSLRATTGEGDQVVRHMYIEQCITYCTYYQYGCSIATVTKWSMSCVERKKVNKQQMDGGLGAWLS